MQVFGPVDFVLAALMIGCQIQISKCRSIRPEFASDDLRRCNPLRLQNPTSNAFVGNIQATFGENILNITEAQRETAI